MRMCLVYRVVLGNVHAIWGDPRGVEFSTGALRRGFWTDGRCYDNAEAYSEDKQGSEPGLPSV